MPSLQTIASICLPAALISMVIRKGIHLHSQGSHRKAILSTVVWVFLLLLAFALKLLPALVESDGQTSCRSNLKNIGVAMTLYAMDHDEIFPPDLQTLSKEMKLAPSLFICPGTAHKAGSLSNLNEWTDYHYISGLNTENNTHSFIIFGHPSNHMGKGANVLFTDFHVKWFPAKRFAFFMNTPSSFFGSNSDSH